MHDRRTQIALMCLTGAFATTVVLASQGIAMPLVSSLLLAMSKSMGGLTPAAVTLAASPSVAVTGFGVSAAATSSSFSPLKRG